MIMEILSWILFGLGVTIVLLLIIDLKFNFLGSERLWAIEPILADLWINRDKYLDQEDLDIINGLEQETKNKEISREDRWEHKLRFIRFLRNDIKTIEFRNKLYKAVKKDITYFKKREKTEKNDREVKRYEELVLQFKIPEVSELVTKNSLILASQEKTY